MMRAADHLDVGLVGEQTRERLLAEDGGVDRADHRTEVSFRHGAYRLPSDTSQTGEPARIEVRGDGVHPDDLVHRRVIQPGRVTATGGRPSLAAIAGYPHP
jgi:hypothetical protein